MPPSPLARLVVCLVCLVAATARADPPPPLRPTRDVDVVYETAREDGAGHEQVLSQRMRWAAGLGKLRVDPPTAGIYMVLDYNRHRLMAVHLATREVLEMDSGAATAAPGVPKGGNLTPLGSDTIVGLACGEYGTRDASGQPIVICLTPDGVLLRATSGDHVLLEAISVAYGPVDAALFDEPSGFKRVGPPPN